MRKLIFLIAILSMQMVRAAMPHASIAVYAVDYERGQVLLDENSEKSLISASSMKLFTTGAALHLLGPEMRFETRLEYDGFIDEQHTLQGNLYIKGGGDPSLGSGRCSIDWQEQLEVWTAAIEGLGIRNIKGRVIGDATAWEKALAVPSWCFEDLGNYYGAGASALSFHENLYSLFFHPGQIGEKAEILRTEPPLVEHCFENEVTTGPEGSGDCACIYGMEYIPKQWVRGTIPFGVEEFVIKGAIPDPPKFCAEWLCRTLEQKGIVVEKLEMASSSRTSFHTTLSPPVGEIVYWTNQKSINLYAEHLLKAIGGVAVVRDFWMSQGIDLGGFQMADGSGISRKNLVTPKQFVQLLIKMKDSKEFFASFPGEQIRAKSGSMSGIRTYVGYKGTIAFAIMINHGPNMKEMYHEILNRLESF